MNDVILSANQVLEVGHLKLSLGAVTEEVQVTAAPTPVQTTSSENSRLVDSTQVANITVKGRDLFAILQMMPGISTGNTYLSQGSGETSSNSAMGSVNINGGASGTTNFTVDGVTAMDTGQNGGPDYAPNMDAIAEVRVLTTNYQAEYGRNANGQISVVTKSGGQAFHGSGSVTMVEVDPHDPSLARPTKPIGIFYSEEKATELSRRYPGWQFAEDSGRGFRQVVPSPIPRRIVELPAIKALVDKGFCVVAAGGGGIPEVRGADGSLKGVEAVVDKDFTAALLARGLAADILLIVTAVDQVFVNYGKTSQRPLTRITSREAVALMDQGHFAPGSMQPKIQAAIEFLDNGGKRAIITSPRMLTRALRGEMGTVITG